MPAIPQIQKQMIESSDYERDLVIWADTGSITLDSIGAFELQIPHSLPFIPLVRAVFSRTPNFTTSYPNGYQEITEQYLSLSLETTSNSTTVDISILGDPNEVWYYRAFGLMPSGASGPVVPTAGLASKFLYSSDNRYTKVLSRGKITQSASIPHNLGWIPQVECWWEYAPGHFNNVPILGALDGELDTPIVANETDIIVDMAGASSVEYRIYLDEY